MAEQVMHWIVVGAVHGVGCETAAGISLPQSRFALEFNSKLSDLTELHNHPERMGKVKDC